MTSRTKEQGAAAPSGNSGFTLISHEKLLQLYTAMVKCRMLEERARALFSPGGFAAYDCTSAGHEATVVAIAIDLLAEDTIAASHRDPIVRLIQGEPLAKIFRRLSGSAARLKRTTRSIAIPARTAAKRLRTASTPDGESLLKAAAQSSTVAAQLKIATEAARVNKRKKNGKIAVAFLGDGAASLDAVPRAVNVARFQQLPILFVFENDLSLQPASFKLHAQAENGASPARALPWITVDGNDVVAVYRVATEAVTQARKGNGPTLIECKPYSLDNRAGAGPGKSRAADQAQRSGFHGPIPGMEDYLTRKGLFRPAFRLEVAAAFSSELDAATKSLNY